MKLIRPLSSRLVISRIGFIALWSLVIWACEQQENSELKSGFWRGDFSFAEDKVPFNFEVNGKQGKQEVYLLNADERVLLQGIKTERDSLIIPIDLFDAVLIGKVENEIFNGFFRKNADTKRGIPFQATFGETHRFETEGNDPLTDLSGKWDFEITAEGGEPNHAVGLLKQQDKKLTGTIMTTTGDYRYFEGQADGKQLLLSAFSGSSPRLIKGVIGDSTHFTAEFISAGGKSTITAVKNENAALPDPYSLTFLKAGDSKFDFTFPDLTGKPVSLRDAKYQNKVVVVTILGSWCPNCMDENAFLSPWYKANKDKGVEIIGLAFERKDDLTFAREKLDRFIKRYDIDYDILFAGKADKKEASEKLPQLNAVLSFPTTLLIDKQGKVRKIHTGFTGPATGEYYDQFVTEFNSEVDQLLKEREKTI